MGGTVAWPAAGKSSAHKAANRTYNDKLTAPAAAVRAHNIPWLAAPAAPSCLGNEGPENWLNEPHMHRLPRLLVQFSR